MSLTRRTHTRLRRAGEDGQVMVEFALILPMFVALLFVIIDFALAMNFASDLNHVAAETARRAAVNQDATFNVTTYAKGAAEPGIRNAMTVNVCLPGGNLPGQVVQVRTRYEHSVMQIIPGMPSFATITLTGRAAMRIETPATFSSQASSNSTPCQ